MLRELLPGVRRSTIGALSLLRAVTLLAQITVGCFAILVAAPAWASPFFVSARAAALCPPTSPFIDDTGQLNGQTLANAQISCGVSTQGAEATVRAQMGDLGVAVSGSSPAHTDGNSGQGIASFQDPLQITSATLAPGTAVTLLVSMNLTGSTELIGPYSASGPDSESTLTGQLGGTEGVYQELYTVGKPVSVTGSKTFTVNSTVGATLTLVGSLTVAARSTLTNVDNSAVSNYLDTATFLVQSETDGVSIVSASGHDYAVPEPGTLMLLGLGTLGLAVARRRAGSC